MRGHVYRRGETWTYVVDIGHDTTGRRRQTSKGGFPTKKDAQAALNVALTSLQQGTFVEPVQFSGFRPGDWASSDPLCLPGETTGEYFSFLDTS